MKEKEIIVPIEGYEKIKVKGCKHKQLVLCSDGDHDWVYCTRCGLRTPPITHRNGAWAEDIFGAAEREGELYRDMTRLRKFYFLNKEENAICSSLGYAEEEHATWWLE